MTAERWAAIPGYVGSYEVSDQGRVQSLERVVNGPNGRHTLRGQIMRGGHNGRYRTVILSDRGRVKNYTVHSLVMLAFVGPRPAGMDVCHNDGDHLNNALENLRYDTRVANMEDARRHTGFWNAKKTHCKNGHEFTEENTRPRTLSNGRTSRACIACSRAKNRTQAAFLPGPPFECETCGRSFGKAHSLSVHLGKKHRKERAS